MAKKKPNPKSITLEGIGTALELGVVTSVDIEKRAIYIEQMKDGRWRMTYTKSLIPELESLTSMRLDWDR